MQEKMLESVCKHRNGAVTRGSTTKHRLPKQACSEHACYAAMCQRLKIGCDLEMSAGLSSAFLFPPPPPPSFFLLSFLAWPLLTSAVPSAAAEEAALEAAAG